MQLAYSIERQPVDETAFLVVGPFEPSLEQIQRATEDDFYRLVDASSFRTEFLAEHLPPNAMTVWEFDKAPSLLQDIFSRGGDEDILIYIPRYLLEKESDGQFYPPWNLRKLVDKSDTCECPTKFTLPDGSQIYVGTH